MLEVCRNNTDGREESDKWILKVKVTQSCPILCNPMDYTVPGILQARILEWVAIPFSSIYTQDRVYYNFTSLPLIKVKSLIMF